MWETAVMGQTRGAEGGEGQTTDYGEGQTGTDTDGQQAAFQSGKEQAQGWRGSSIYAYSQTPDIEMESPVTGKGTAALPGCGTRRVLPPAHAAEEEAQASTAQ